MSSRRTLSPIDLKSASARKASSEAPVKSPNRERAVERSAKRYGFVASIASKSSRRLMASVRSASAAFHFLQLLVHARAEHVCAPHLCWVGLEPSACNSFTDSVRSASASSSRSWRWRTVARLL